LIGPITSGTTSGQDSAGVGSLTSQNFLQLMVAQLQYQDPMSPMDASALMQQTSSLTDVQTMQDMSSLLQSVLGMQEASTATSMLGQNVTATDAKGNPVSGVVSNVSYTATGPTLDVGGTEVPISEISTASLASAAAATTSATGNGTQS
jgi:flagellar basal-body rod modification protein FlgD